MANIINSKPYFNGTFSTADWQYHGYDNNGVRYTYSPFQAVPYPTQPIMVDDPVPVPIGIEHIRFYISGIPYLNFDEIKLIVDAFDTDEERFAAIELVKELKRKLGSV